MSTNQTENLGPDGEKVVDMEYYELLGVASNADDAAIKKAYKKAALKYHPDRNIGDETAAAKFQEIGLAYAVLSDSNKRAVYNKQGKSSVVDGDEEMPDPGMIFAKLFGGDAFKPWIGEISLGKDVSQAFEMNTTEEEREAMKAEMAGQSTPFQSTITHTGETKETNDDASPEQVTSPPTSGSTTPEIKKTEKLDKAAEREKYLAEREKAHAARAAEREKMAAFEKKRQEEKKTRVEDLKKELIERIRPFVESTNPGSENDPETIKFMDRMREEAKDLTMESFGVEICHLIGEIYMVKANNYIALHKTARSNFLGIKGWTTRVKEKASMFKEGWSFLSVGMDVKSTMEDLEKRTTKGEVSQEEMAAIEADLSGKLLLVAWKGSRFELSSILRQVVDGVLSKDSPDVNEAILMNRAKAILVTGAILKSVQPDETDVERRELEKLVAEANAKRKAPKEKKPKK